MEKLPLLCGMQLDEISENYMLSFSNRKYILLEHMFIYVQVTKVSRYDRPGDAITAQQDDVL